VQAAKQQKTGYDLNTHTRIFQANDPVWLLIPCQGKLSSKWQAGWRVNAVKSAVTVEICNNKGWHKVVHINCVQHCIQPPDPSGTTQMPDSVLRPWNPPQIEHIVIPCYTAPPTSTHRYPSHNRQPPDRLQP